MNRKEGYYWVKYKGEWDIWYWYSKGYFGLCRNIYYRIESQLDEINETQILPPNN